MKRCVRTTLKLLIVNVLMLSSCNTPKYTYMFDSGKYMDFGEGKWLLNQTKSNSKIFDAELYDVSLTEFRKIIGDSLMTINDVRRKSLIPPVINFNLEKEKLLELKNQTGCEYLINVKGNIIKQGLGAVSVPTNDLDYYSSNESSVEIKIYQLETGIEISSSIVLAKIVDQGEISKTNSIPKLNNSTHTAMLTAAKKLISKYDTYSK